MAGSEGLEVSGGLGEEDGKWVVGEGLGSCEGFVTGVACWSSGLPSSLETFFVRIPEEGDSVLGLSVVLFM